MLSDYFSGVLMEVIFKPELVKYTFFHRRDTEEGEGGVFSDTMVSHRGRGQKMA